MELLHKKDIKWSEADNKKKIQDIYDIVLIIEKNQRIKQLKENSTSIRESAEALKESSEKIKSSIDSLFDNLNLFRNQQENSINELKISLHQDCIPRKENEKRLDELETVKLKNEQENERLKQENDQLETENAKMILELKCVMLKNTQLEEENERLQREIQKLRGTTLSELNKNIRLHKPVPFFAMPSNGWGFMTRNFQSKLHDDTNLEIND